MGKGKGDYHAVTQIVNEHSGLFSAMTDAPCMGEG